MEKEREGRVPIKSKEDPKRVVIVVVTLLLSVIPALRFHSTSDDHPFPLSENSAPLTGQRPTFHSSAFYPEDRRQKTSPTVYSTWRYTTHHMYESAAPPGFG